MTYKLRPITTTKQTLKLVESVKGDDGANLVFLALIIVEIDKEETYNRWKMGTERPWEDVSWTGEELIDYEGVDDESWIWEKSTVLLLKVGERFFGFWWSLGEKDQVIGVGEGHIRH